MQKIRIQKIIADSGFCSRRRAEKMISQNRVKCNGHLVSLGYKASPTDKISIDNKIINNIKDKQYKYIMLNKPRGYVSTMSDSHGRKCVAELVSNVKTRVYPIGRLDLASEGLLLFTNDGDLANKIMHPKGHISKTYRVTVRPDINDEQLTKLAEGVYIDGKKTMPAIVHIISKEPNRVVLSITITEGRNRQIRKMMEKIGLQVARLKRTNVGPIKLGMLKPGCWRELKPLELKALKNAVKKSYNDS